MVLLLRKGCAQVDLPHGFDMGAVVGPSKDGWVGVPPHLSQCSVKLGPHVAPDLRMNGRQALTALCVGLFGHSAAF